MANRFALAAALALAFAPATSTAAPLKSASARLAALAARYETHLREERPDLGTRARLARCDDRLLPVTEATIVRDSVLLEGLIGEAGDLLARGLPASQQRALTEIHTRMVEEAAPLRSSAWRRDPSLYLAFVRDAVFDVARKKHVSPCERERRTLRRLRAVPEVLRSAEVNLGAQAAFDPGAEEQRWTATMLELRTTLPASFPECRDAIRYADLIQADSLALGAARRFVALLKVRGDRASSE